MIRSWVESLHHISFLFIQRPEVLVKVQHLVSLRPENILDSGKKNYKQIHFGIPHRTTPYFPAVNTSINFISKALAKYTLLQVNPLQYSTCHNNSHEKVEPTTSAYNIERNLCTQSEANMLIHWHSVLLMSITFTIIIIIIHWLRVLFALSRSLWPQCLSYNTN